MSVLWKYVSGALLIALVIAIFLVFSFRGSAAISRARADKAELQVTALGDALKQSEAARVAEHAQAVRFGLAANQYEQDKTDAEATASQLAADLRAERVRLRPVWRCPAANVPGIATGAGQPDAAASDRAESAARVVRAAAESDAQIRALQAILTAERQP
ncbi:MAG TPA: hypothetical protein VGV14_01505 [Rhodanobacter sp.]|nr:hypothetical protein [Rhodanobacter sp.]